MMATHDKVIAKSPQSCCLRGTIHEGEAKGKVVKIQDVDTYIAEPPAGKANGNIVFVGHPRGDVFGHFINNFLLMDAFAAAGYLTFGPDYFRGDPIWKHRGKYDHVSKNPDFDFTAWKDKHKPFCDEFVPGFVKEVQSTYGKVDTKYGCVGYCWGAPFVCNELSSKGICSAGAFAHPGALDESHFYNLNAPLFLSCSEIDHTFPKEFRNRAIDILDQEKKRYALQLFQGVEHGFALRGNMDDPWERYTKEQSFQGVVDWFDLWLTK